jgi:phage terminase large subunit GpA-like protein
MSESQRRGKGISEATQVYKDHRAEMDEGAQVAWPENFKPDEISGLQSAMNLYYEDEESFFSECQNDPKDKEIGDQELMTADEIASKLSNYDRRAIPEACDTLVAFVDVQKNILFFVIMAFEESGSGYVIDYGTYPDQRRAYYTKRDIKKSYLAADVRGGFEAKLTAALTAITNDFCTKRWTRDDGMEMTMDLMMLDANWEQSKKSVYEHCRTTPYRKQVRPAHGRYFGATTTPMSEYVKKKGDKIGHQWRMPNPKGRAVIRYVQFDTNYWKMYVHDRFAVDKGGAGCFSIFGNDPKKHKMFADHMTSENAFLVEAKGRKVMEFKVNPGNPDNDFLDCTVGCAVAASVMGVQLKALGQTRKKEKKTKRKMSEMLEEKRRNRDPR